MSFLSQVSEVVTAITRPGNETSEGKNTRWLQIAFYGLALAEIILSATVKSDSYGGLAIILGAIFAALKSNKDYVDARTRLKETAAGIFSNPAISTVLDTLRTAATPDPVSPVRPSIFSTAQNPIFPKEAPVLKIQPRETPSTPGPAKTKVEITTPDGETETQEFDSRLEAVTFANKIRASQDLPEGAKVFVL